MIEIGNQFSNILPTHEAVIQIQLVLNVKDDLL
jgi:hypothetical protein